MYIERYTEKSFRKIFSQKSLNLCESTDCVDNFLSNHVTLGKSGATKGVNIGIEKIFSQILKHRKGLGVYQKN